MARQPAAAPYSELSLFALDRTGGSPAAGPHGPEEASEQGGTAAIAALARLRAEHRAAGHTPASDAAEGPKRLATLIAREGEQVRAFAFKPAVDVDHRALRTHALKVAAFALALVDALDFQRDP